MNMRTLYHGVFLLAVLGLAGCKSHKTVEQNTADSKEMGEAQAGTAQRGEGADPCSLLQQSEVEAVTGRLAGPPYRSRDAKDDPEPVAGGDSCVYETPDFRNIQIAVTWTNGAEAFKLIGTPMQIFNGVSGKAETADTAKNAAKKLLPNAPQVEGDWDEASSLGCCMIFALRGDSLVKFDFRAWRPDTKAAVSILNKALARLDHPLAVDGNAGNQAALKRAVLRPQPRAACSLLSRAEVESVLGPLSAEPQSSSSDSTEGCLYRFTQAESKESTLAEAPKELKSFMGAVTGGRTGLVRGPVETTMSILWRGGYRQLSENAMISGAVMGNLQGVPGLPKRTEGKVEKGPWDEAAQTSLSFAAVKRDVAIAIDTEPMLSSEQVELRRRLVARAIEKISSKE